VTCTGAPFYAGWGLTEDLGNIPERRNIHPRPDLIQLCYAALIAYPRYNDPVTGAPCPPEVVLHRLISGSATKTGISLRILSKIQGRLASLSHWWR
jgi:capsular polysaccharide export protein